VGKADHPARRPRPALELDDVCRDCGKVFAGLADLAAHYDLSCRPADRTVAAGKRYTPNNVVDLANIRRQVRR
jgi:hypothetical protein